jgi:hypothetical protein
MLAVCFANAQSVIELHSIATLRQPAGDGGYTLDGIHMVDSRSKIENAANFGASGTYQKSIIITDFYPFSGDLETMSSFPIDLFYFGIFDNANGSLNTFTSAELDTLYDWSVRGGKLIIGAGSPNLPFFNPNVLNSKWGFDLALAAPTSISPTTAGNNSTLFNGPFGVVISASQGGSSQGYFTIYPSNAVILADNGFGNPTLYLDCNTLDLVVADGDAYTDLGGVTFGNAIASNNDRLWANTIAYMDELQDPPTITQNGSTLSTGTYLSYQWYLNGNVIPGATNNTHNATQPGNYSVEVSMDCGCSNVASQEVFVVGNNEPGSSLYFSFSPNPASDLITIQHADHAINSIEIYDQLGRLLIDQQLNRLNGSGHTIDISQLERGTYYLSVYAENGVMSTKKLLKY